MNTRYLPHSLTDAGVWRPTRLRWRSFIWRFHRRMALGLGWALALMGLSGSLLVYRGEIHAWLHPEQEVAEASVPRAGLNAIMTAAYRVFPADSGSWRVGFPRQAADPVEITYLADDPFAGPSGPVRILIDPYRLQVLGLIEPDSEPVAGWLYRFHSTWLLNTKGNYWVAGLGGIFLIVLSSGLYLWWPQRRGGRRRVSSVHQRIGLVGAPVLMISIVTGLYLALPHTWLPEIYPRKNQFDSPVVVPSDGVMLTPEQVAVVGTDATHGLALRELQLPVSRRDPYRLAFYVPGTPDVAPAWLAVWIDPYRGEVLAKGRVGGDDWRNRLARWVCAVHDGRALGDWGRAIMAAGGLLPLLLAVSGTRLWWKRRQRASTGS